MRGRTHPFTRHTVGKGHQLVGTATLFDTPTCRMLPEMTAEDLVEFEALLSNDDALSSEIAEVRRIHRQLTEIGADILEEPIPDALLEALLGPSQQPNQLTDRRSGPHARSSIVR